MSTKAQKIAILGPGGSTNSGKIFLTAIILASIFQATGNPPVLYPKGLKTEDSVGDLQITVITNESTVPETEMTAVIKHLTSIGVTSTLQSAIGLVAGKCGVLPKDFKITGIASAQEFINELPDGIEITVELLTEFFKRAPFAVVDVVENEILKEMVTISKQNFVWEAFVSGTHLLNETARIIQPKYPLTEKMMTEEFVVRFLKEKNITDNTVIFSQKRSLTTVVKKEVLAMTLTTGFDISEKEVRNLCGMKKIHSTKTTEIVENVTTHINYFTGQLTGECTTDSWKAITKLLTAMKNSEITTKSAITGGTKREMEVHSSIIG